MRPMGGDSEQSSVLRALRIPGLREQSKGKNKKIKNKKDCSYSRINSKVRGIMTIEPPVVLHNHYTELLKFAIHGNAARQAKYKLTQGKYRDMALLESSQGSLSRELSSYCP